MKRIIFFAVLVLSNTVFAQRPEMVLIDGGTFIMGSNGATSLDEKPEHQVTVSSFEMGKYEVTFDEFDLFCKATGYPMPDDGGYGRGKNPVMNISWQGAVMYCNWLSSKFNMEKVYQLKVDSMGMHIVGVNWDANGYRLPTEAEWEYAARGGNKGAIYQPLTDFAWYSENAEGKPHEVGTLKPNSLGLFDILGNAWEWCWDNYDKSYYSKSPKTDPRGPGKDGEKVYRGGNFSSDENFVHFSRRYHFVPTIKKGMVGMRLVRKAE